jgi:single-stranded-DNA-specific exonuclease
LPEDAAVALARPGELQVDLVLPARYLDWALLREIADLAPFGASHPEPLLAVTGLTVGDARRVGADASHLSFRLRKGYETLDAIVFGLDAERPTPEAGMALDVVGTLESRTLDGEPRLQLRLLDFAATEASPLVGRRRPVPAVA